MIGLSWVPLPRSPSAQEPFMVPTLLTSYGQTAGQEFAWARFRAWFEYNAIERGLRGVERADW
jgi:hypothetical protein